MLYALLQFPIGLLNAVIPPIFNFEQLIDGNMKHILGSCVLAGLFLFCACDDTLDTKVTWQIGDSDTWRVPELAQGVLYKAYNGIANRPDCFEDNFLDCATDNACCTHCSSSRSGC